MSVVYNINDINNINIEDVEHVNTEKYLQGDRIPIKDIFEKEIIVTGFKVLPSKYSDRYAYIQFFKKEDKTRKIYVIQTGSQVLIEQCEERVDENDIFQIFIGKIVSIKNGNKKYYAFR